MATEKKYLDLEGLKTYNEQVKSLIDTKETSGTAPTIIRIIRINVTFDST